MTTYELHAPPGLADLDSLSTEVKDRVKAADWQTFIVAMTVLLGGGYALVNPATNSDVKLVVAGFVGAVITYFFQNKNAATTAAATIAASQSGSASSQASSAQGAAQGVKP